MTNTTTDQGPEQSLADETIEAPPEPTAAQRLDEAIRAEARRNIRAAIESTWSFLGTVGKDDQEIRKLVAGTKHGRPSPGLENALTTSLLTAVAGSIVSKAKATPAERPRRKPSPEDLERAEQRARIEAGSVHEVDVRQLINDQRRLDGTPPLPEKEG